MEGRLQPRPGKPGHVAVEDSLRHPESKEDLKMSKRWTLAKRNEALEKEISSALGLWRPLAAVLIARGMNDVAKARAFLQPHLKDLHEPELLPGIEAAIERINYALSRREKIVIYGDYDADGVTATVLLQKALALSGAKADFYLPHRIEEGYGLNIEALKKIKSAGADLVITVDCGTTATEEVKFAKSIGLDLIITDHHEPLGDVPEASALVNPKLKGSVYPFEALAGVGIAFKLAWALARRLSAKARVSEEFRQFLLDAVGLVALGTISDVVPLLGENRALARSGLEKLRQSQSKGIRALIKSAGLSGTEITSRDVSFRLGPRLNAAGRLGTAHQCIELLTTDSESRAEELARWLEENNRSRQKIQREMLAEVHEKIESEVNLREAYGLVLEGNWHRGVVGIVAGKVAEEYNRPAVLLSADGGKIEGSARSTPAVHMMEVLAECRDYLEKFGGHSQAAGLQIKRGKSEEFRIAFNEAVKKRVRPEELEPHLEVDAEVTLEEMTVERVNQLGLLEPTGEGNPPPLFLARGLQIAGEPRRIGSRLQHIVFYARQGKTALKALIFGKEELIREIEGKPDRFDLVFGARTDTWGGTEEVNLIVEDIS